MAFELGWTPMGAVNSMLLYSDFQRKFGETHQYPIRVFPLIRAYSLRPRNFPMVSGHSLACWLFENPSLNSIVRRVISIRASCSFSSVMLKVGNMNRYGSAIDLLGSPAVPCPSSEEATKAPRTAFRIIDPPNT